MKTFRNYLSFKIGYLLRIVRALIFIFLISLYFLTGLSLKEGNIFLQNVSIFVIFVTFVEMTVINYQEKLFGTWFMVVRHKRISFLCRLMYFIISLLSAAVSFFSLYYLCKNYNDEYPFMVLLYALVLFWIITTELGHWIAEQVYLAVAENKNKTYPNYKFHL